MLGVVADRLPSDHGLGGECQVVFTGVQVSQVVRVVAAGDLDPDAMPFGEQVAGRTPEIDRVRIPRGRARSNSTAQDERATSLLIAVPGTHHAFRQE